MSYSNPQRIRNKEFDALDKTADSFNKTSQGFFDVVKTQKAFALARALAACSIQARGNTR